MPDPTPETTPETAEVFARVAAGSLIIGLGVEVEPPEVLAIERAWQQQPRVGDQVVATTG